MGEKTLQPLEQKAVDFYGDEIVAVRTEDGQIMVPIRPICDLLGINWDGQRQRIGRDSILSAESANCTVITTAQDGTEQGRAMTCLPLDYIAGFLFGISENRVKPQLKPQLERYKRECYKVLADAFSTGRLSYHSQIMNADSPAAQAYQIATALQSLARYQWVQEQRLESAETQISLNADTLAQHTQRIGELESQLGNPARLVTPDQASQISQAVKAIARELGKRSSRNEYGGVYGELYRRFSVTTYKELPANQYSEAMNWLKSWYQDLTDGAEIPF
jgi:hypothetical protein